MCDVYSYSRCVQFLFCDVCISLYLQYFTQKKHYYLVYLLCIFFCFCATAAAAAWLVLVNPPKWKSKKWNNEIGSTHYSQCSKNWRRILSFTTGNSHQALSNAQLNIVVLMIKFMHSFYGAMCWWYLIWLQMKRKNSLKFYHL